MDCKELEVMKFTVEELSEFSIENSIDKIEACNPKRIIATIEKEKCKIGFIVISNRGYYKLFRISFDNINFSQWIIDAVEIKRVYTFLNSIYKKYPGLINGAFISKEDCLAIYSGKADSKNITNKYRNDGLYWFEDLFDFNHKFEHLKITYESYGKWFIEAQKCFKAALEQCI